MKILKTSIFSLLLAAIVAVSSSFIFPKQTEWIIFKFKHGEFIQNSSSYKFTNNLITDRFSFTINTDEVYKNLLVSEEYILSREITEKYQTKLLIKNVIRKQDNIYIKIVFDTDWEFNGGKYLSGSEVVEENKKIKCKGQYDKLISIVDDKGNKIDGSDVGSGFENGQEYFLIQMPESEFKNSKRVTIDFSGCNVITYVRKK